MEPTNSIKFTIDVSGKKKIVIYNIDTDRFYMKPRNNQVIMALKEKDDSRAVVFGDEAYFNIDDLSKVDLEFAEESIKIEKALREQLKEMES